MDRRLGGDAAARRSDVTSKTVQPQKSPKLQGLWALSFLCSRWTAMVVSPKGDVLHVMRCKINCFNPH